MGSKGGYEAIHPLTKPQVHLNVIRMLRDPGVSPWFQAAGGKPAAVNTALRRASAKLGDVKASTAQWLGRKNNKKRAKNSIGGRRKDGGMMIFLWIIWAKTNKIEGNNMWTYDYY